VSIATPATASLERVPTAEELHALHFKGITGILKLPKTFFLLRGLSYLAARAAAPHTR